jgi:hypothetical protein
VTDELTDYGFTFGACEVTRLAALPDGSVCLRIATTGGKRIDVYVSPTGRSLRVFSPSAEWKPEASGVVS